eukprot:gnl/Chilomastix_cuspidata/3959.p1 GENE.gnl/Chilomastix_cuspidata/3959~~gnl/Chilomastix_cuspidata/3959.p1  ORF type:complete len:375 (+),score=170.91 gnl/Chilomastix_cuspidata/3959:505-1629(+)
MASFELPSPRGDLSRLRMDLRKFKAEVQEFHDKQQELQSHIYSVFEKLATDQRNLDKYSATLWENAQRLQTRLVAAEETALMSEVEDMHTETAQMRAALEALREECAQSLISDPHSVIDEAAAYAADVVAARLSAALSDVTARTKAEVEALLSFEPRGGEGTLAEFRGAVDAQVRAARAEVAAEAAALGTACEESHARWRATLDAAATEKPAAARAELLERNFDAVAAQVHRAAAADAREQRLCAAKLRQLLPDAERAVEASVSAYIERQYAATDGPPALLAPALQRRLRDVSSQISRTLRDLRALAVEHKNRLRKLEARTYPEKQRIAPRFDAECAQLEMSLEKRVAMAERKISAQLEVAVHELRARLAAHRQ